MTKFIAFTAFLFSLQASALIGGVDVPAQDSMSRSVVALQIVESESTGKINRYKGSGVLIRPDVILTAGHNVFYLPDVSLSEAIFSVEPKWGPDTNGQTRIPVKRVEVYPGFSQGSLGTQNDLALVFLAQPAPREYEPLNMELHGKDEPILGEMGTLLGFGRSTESSSAPLSDYRLRKLDLPFARWENRSITDSQKIWFSSKHGSIAGGDSGGPVLFKRGDSYRIYGIGIHQRYDSCVQEKTCEPQSAYTNITYFRDWIEEKLSEAKLIQP